MARVRRAGMAETKHGFETVLYEALEPVTCIRCGAELGQGTRFVAYPQPRTVPATQRVACAECQPYSAP